MWFNLNITLSTDQGLNVKHNSDIAKNRTTEAKKKKEKRRCHMKKFQTF